MLEWCTLSQMVRLYSGQVVVVVVSSLVVGWLVVCDEMIHMVKKGNAVPANDNLRKITVIEWLDFFENSSRPLSSL